MKKVLFIIVFVLMCVTVAWGVMSTFTWDANTESDLAGYRLYRSSVSGQYDFGFERDMTHLRGWISEIPAGTETFDYDMPEGTWYFVLTAYDTSGNESGASNEVTKTIDTTPPADPSGLQCN